MRKAQTALFSARAHTTPAAAAPQTPGAQPETPPTKGSEPTLDEFKQWLAERSKRIAALNLAIKNRQDKEAIEAAKPLVDTDRKLMTFVDKAVDATSDQKNSFRRQFVDTAGWLAAKSEEADQCETAVALRTEIVAVLVKQHGPNHWKVIDGKLAAAHAKTLLGWTAAERGSWGQLSDNRRGAMDLRLSGKYVEAILAYQGALKSYEALKGADDSDYAEILNNHPSKHAHLKPSRKPKLASKSPAMNDPMIAASYSKFIEFIHAC